MSRLTDESTSAERQRELIQLWADSNDHEVVGWAEDLDVSGSVDPFDAPALLEWWERENEWDILCAWKLDRIGRRAIPLNKVFGWMLEHGKTLVCVSDNIDLSNWVGRLVANVIAGVAEGELEAIKERTKASRRKLLESGRWPGGITPRGFRTVPLDTGGFKLEIDPETAPAVRQMVADVIAGRTVDEIAKGLGEHPTQIWSLLESPSLVGHATYQGVTVRDREGMPVLWGEPLLTLEEWSELKKALAARKRGVGPRVNGVSPLHGVVFCPECDTALFHRRFNRKYGKGEYRYYFCRNKHSKGMNADQLEDLVFGMFLDEFGDDPVLHRIYVPAENHQIELEEARRAVDELSQLVGTMTSDGARKALTEQLRARDLEIKRLEAMPSREAGWTYEETGQTFTDVWHVSSIYDKRQMVIDKEITARAIRTGDTIDYYIQTQKSPLSEVRTEP